MVEALADGVVEDTLDGAPRSTVIRVSDDPAIREAVAREAEAWADALPRFGYDSWTIGRIVVVGLLGRLSFLTVPAAAPLVGPTVHSLAVTVGFEAAAVVSLYRLQRPMHRLALHLPWPDPPATGGRSPVRCRPGSRPRRARPPPGARPGPIHTGLLPRSSNRGVDCRCLPPTTGPHLRTEP